jgi:biotin carboxylase
MTLRRGSYPGPSRSAWCHHVPLKEGGGDPVRGSETEAKAGVLWQLVLKMREGAMSQGMQVVLELEKPGQEFSQVSSRKPWF